MRTLQDLFDKHGINEPMCMSDLPSGWYDLADRLITDLIALGWDKQLDQIKEKFAELRFYIGSGSDAMHDRISRAEEESGRTCETCGAEGKIRNHGGWFVTLCDKHEEATHAR